MLLHSLAGIEYDHEEESKNTKEKSLWLQATHPDAFKGLLCHGLVPYNCSLATRSGMSAQATTVLRHKSNNRLSGFFSLSISRIVCMESIQHCVINGIFIEISSKGSLDM